MTEARSKNTVGPSFERCEKKKPPKIGHLIFKFSNAVHTSNFGPTVFHKFKSELWAHGF